MPPSLPSMPETTFLLPQVSLVLHSIIYSYQTKLAVACIVLVWCGQQSKYPHESLDRGIKMLDVQPHLRAQICKSVKAACLQHSVENDCTRLVDQVAEIIMVNVASFPSD